MYSTGYNSSAKLMDVPIIEPSANGCSNNRDSTVDRVKALYILFCADLLRPLTLPTIATYILKRSNFEYTLLRYTHIHTYILHSIARIKDRITIARNE